MTFSCVKLHLLFFSFISQTPNRGHFEIFFTAVSKTHPFFIFIMALFITNFLLA